MIDETRRSVLSLSLGGLAALGTGAVGYGAYRLLRSEKTVPSQRVDLSSIKPGVVARLTIGTRNGAIYHAGGAGFTAYILACTRAGCPLERLDIGEGKPDEWRCTCDGSRFALTGEALSGPAIHPLRRIAARYEGAVMIVPPALGKVTLL